ncbi:hypothetical protein [Geomicrobium sp. JCM 19055]|uniref:hypothetical protein n=1 Tax=Geomicrobium sp. JCM 19055 TaxID=1460649 RepID=UPI0012688EBE|nr:hypothetical protein [Geomicrobium sp. JCM 19055]
MLSYRASHDDLRLTNKGSSTAIAYSNGVEPTCFAAAAGVFATTAAIIRHIEFTKAKVKSITSIL